jgi:hypothetical protein
MDTYNEMKKAHKIVAEMLEDSQDELFTDNSNVPEDDFESEFEAEARHLRTLPKVSIHGKMFAVDIDSLSLIDCEDPTSGGSFETERDLWDYIEQNSKRSKEEVEGHVFKPSWTNWNLDPAKEPPVYSAEQKQAHEVFRHGNFSILKLPHDPDFIQREGISMQHCLSVVHKDYCKRMVAQEIEVYSLTDLRDNEPRVDIEVSLLRSSYGGPVAAPTVTQIRGIRNECPPKDEYLEPIMAFFATKNWKISGHGIKNFDGKIDGDLVTERWHTLNRNRRS